MAIFFPSWIVVSMVVVKRYFAKLFSVKREIIVQFADNDSDDFAVEEDGAIRDTQNDELGFLFASRRTQSGRVVKRRLFFRRNFSKCNGG